MNKHLLIFMCLLPVATLGQNDSLGNEEVNVIKPYQPTLSDAYKISEVPEPDTASSRSPRFDYVVIPRRISSSFETSPIRPQKQSDEMPAAETRNYAKGGVGNYMTTYAEAYTRLARNKEYSAGLHLKHLSSQGRLGGKGYSGVSENSAGVFGSRFFQKSVVDADLGYRRDAIHYYGYDADTSSLPPVTRDISQRFRRIGAKVSWKGTNVEKNAFIYKIDASYRNLAEEPYFLLNGLRYRLVEHNPVIGADLSLPLGKFIYGLTTLVDYTQDDNGQVKKGQAIIVVDPKITKQGKFWMLTTGTNLTFQPKSNDAGNTKWNPYIFSDVDFKLTIKEDLFQVYGGIGGGLIKNNFLELTEQNPFLTTLAPTDYSRNNLELKLGARGSVSRFTAWNASATFSTIDDMPFFVNDWNPNLYPRTLLNKFTLVYDNDVEVLNLHGEVFQKIGDKLDISFGGDYYHYATNLEHAWHKPSTELKLSADYRLGSIAAIKALEKGRFLIRGDIYYSGPRWALMAVNDPVNNYVFSPVRLKGFIDANVGAEYRHTERLAFFLRFNNLASQHYQRWLNYPVQGFQVLGGASFIF